MEIDITTSAQMLEFIKRPDVSLKDAQDIAINFLKVITIFEYENKEHLISSVEAFVNRWGDDCQERPIFLDQLKEHFMIKDIATNHTKHETPRPTKK